MIHTSSWQQKKAPLPQILLLLILRLHMLLQVISIYNAHETSEQKVEVEAKGKVRQIRKKRKIRQKMTKEKMYFQNLK